jgi:hypothetical protein
MITEREKKAAIKDFCQKDQKHGMALPQKYCMRKPKKVYMYVNAINCNYKHDSYLDPVTHFVLFLLWWLHISKATLAQQWYHVEWLFYRLL